MQHEGFAVHGVADLREDRLKEAGKTYPSLKLTKDADELLQHADINVIAIATPLSTPFNFAKKAIENGKHVLVEKPLVTRIEQVEELIKNEFAKADETAAD